MQAALLSIDEVVDMREQGGEIVIKPIRTGRAAFPSFEFFARFFAILRKLRSYA